MASNVKNEKEENPPSEPKAEEDLNISEFYEGRSVFITGATGFLGKVLVYKLLTGCKDIAKIFVLIAESCELGNKNNTFGYFVEDPIFENIPENERKTQLDKIIMVPVDYDINKPETSLEYKIQDFDMDQMKQVSVVFHLQGTSEFDNKKKAAWSFNWRSTKRILTFCRKYLRELKALVYVSTARSHSKTLRAPEEVEYVYSSFLYDAIRGKRSYEEEVHFEDIRPWRDFHTFTKKMGEEFLKNNAGSISTAIFRLGLLGAASMHPEPGYIDTKKRSYGDFTGLLAFIIKGLIRARRGNSNDLVQIVPVDFAANAIIACAWHINRLRIKRHQRGHDSAFSNIYNYVPDPSDGLTWERLSVYLEYSIKKYPIIQSHWPYEFSIKPFYALWFYYCTTEWIAQLVLYISRCYHDKLRLVQDLKDAEKPSRFLDVLKKDAWTHSTRNVIRMISAVKKNDKEDLDKFYMDLNFLDWAGYFDGYICGIHKFIFRLHRPDYIAGQRKMQKLRIYHGFLLFFGFFFLIISFIIAHVIFTMLPIFFHEKLEVKEVFNYNNP